MDATSKRKPSGQPARYKAGPLMPDRRRTQLQKPKSKWRRSWESDAVSSCSIDHSEVATGDSSGTLLPSCPLKRTEMSSKKREAVRESNRSCKRAKRSFIQQSQVTTLTFIGSSDTSRTTSMSGARDFGDPKENILVPVSGLNTDSFEEADICDRERNSAQSEPQNTTVTSIVRSTSPLTSECPTRFTTRAKRSNRQHLPTQDWGKALLLSINDKIVTAGTLVNPQGSRVGPGLPGLRSTTSGSADLETIDVMPSTRTVQKFQGINFYKRIGRWTTHLWAERKQFYIGSYPTATQAASAYDKASLKHFGKHAQLNYKRSSYLQDIQEMDKWTNKEYRNILKFYAKRSKHVKVAEGVTVCPKGWFEVRFRDHARPKKWTFLGTFGNLADAKRCYRTTYRRHLNLE